MARTGRPPKPVEVKRRTGNPGKRPLPSTVVLALSPVPERSVWEHDPLEVFDRVMAEGAGWLGVTDSVVLALVRDALEERKGLAALAVGSHEARKDLRALEQQLTTWLSALGFDPTARSRLGVAEVKAQSKMEELRTRRAAREASR